MDLNRLRGLSTDVNKVFILRHHLQLKKAKRLQYIVTFLILGHKYHDNIVSSCLASGDSHPYCMCYCVAVQ